SRSTRPVAPERRLSPPWRARDPAPRQRVTPITTPRMARTLRIDGQGRRLQPVVAGGRARIETNRHAASIPFPGRLAPWRRLLAAPARTRHPHRAVTHAARAAPFRADA